MSFLKIQRTNYINYIYKLQNEEILPKFSFNKIRSGKEMDNFIEKYLKFKKIIKNITYERKTVKKFYLEVDEFLMKNKEYLSEEVNLTKLRNCKMTVKYMHSFLYEKFYREKYNKIISHANILECIKENTLDKKIMHNIFNEHKLFFKYCNTEEETDLVEIMQKNNIDLFNFFNAFYLQWKFDFKFLIEEHKIRNINAFEKFINRNSEEVFKCIPDIFYMRRFKNLNIFYMIFERKDKFNEIFYKYVFNSLITHRVERGRLLMVMENFRSITIFNRVMNLFKEKNKYRVYDQINDVKINLPVEYMKGNSLHASFLIKYNSEMLRISLIQYLVLCKKFNFNIKFESIRLHYSNAYTIDKIYAEYEKFIWGEKTDEKFTDHFKNLHNYLKGKNTERNLLPSVHYANKTKKKQAVLNEQKLEIYKIKSVFMKELKQKKTIKLTNVKINRTILNSLVKARLCKIVKGKVEYLP